MLAKPSPDAMKMLNKIEEHFNKAFKNNQYTSHFRHIFKHLFRIDWAHQFSLMGSNDAYIIGLGFIDCWDFEKNIEMIENKVNTIIKKKEQSVSRFENIVHLIEKDKNEGKLEDEFLKTFYKNLERVRKLQEAEDPYEQLMPFFLNELTGDVQSDYLVVKKELTLQIERNKKRLERNNSSNVLYQQLCDWIDSPQTKKQYGSRRLKAMKEKLALLGRDGVESCELKNIEAAKKLISEVFYPDQEKYYKQLENWAETELDDKNCSQWISFYLWNGRTMPIQQVKVLRFKDDLEKGKAFLLSKYEEKLGWDKKKKQDRKYRHCSLFDSFDENYNSFQEIWNDFENSYSLFPICICANVKEKDYPKSSIFEDWTDGLKIQHDTIKFSLWIQNMTLQSTNRYFYTYQCKYKKSNNKFVFYGDKAFSLIKEYLLYALPDFSFNENIVGCVTMIDYKNTQTTGITALLSYSKEDYSASSKILANFNNKKNSLAANGLQNTVGYRVFTNAAIFHIAKKIGHSIDLPLDKPISDLDFKSLLEDIDSKQHELSFEDRYLCHFINTSKYKFPIDQTDIFEKFRLSRRINLFHDVQNHYSTPIFQEWQFPFGKIVNQYNNNEFKKNTESIGSDFYKYKDEMNVCLDKTNKHFLFNLRTLCYLNWVFVANDTGNVKKIVVPLHPEISPLQLKGYVDVAHSCRLYGAVSVL